MNGKAVLHIVTLASVGFAAAMAAADAFAAGATSGKTREQVRAELAQWMRNPVTSDGYRFVGGEIGYEYVGRSAAQPGALGSGTGAGLTREQVRQEYEQFRRNPITVDGYRFIGGGEVGFVYDGQAAASSALGSGTGTAMRGMTRAQVRQELLEFQRNPVSADGHWRYTGGETGWVPLGAAFERRDGAWVRVR